MNDKSKVVVQEKAIREFIRSVLGGEEPVVSEAPLPGKRKVGSLKSQYDTDPDFTDYATIMKGVNKDPSMKQLKSPSSVRLVDQKAFDRLKFLFSDVSPEERDEVIAQAAELYKKSAKLGSIDQLSPSDKRGVMKAALDAYKEELIKSGELSWSEQEYLKKHPDANAALASGEGFKAALQRFWGEVKSSPHGPIHIPSFRDKVLPKFWKELERKKGHKPGYIETGEEE